MSDNMERDTFRRRTTISSLLRTSSIIPDFRVRDESGEKSFMQRFTLFITTPVHTGTNQGLQQECMT